MVHTKLSLKPVNGFRLGACHDAWGCKENVKRLGASENDPQQYINFFRAILCLKWLKIEYLYIMLWS